MCRKKSSYVISKYLYQTMTRINDISFENIDSCDEWDIESQLKNVLLTHRITEAATKDIQRVLRRRMPSLQLNSENVLRHVTLPQPRPMCGGSYVHNGLAKCLVESIYEAGMENYAGPFVYVLHFDGYAHQKKTIWSHWLIQGMAAYPFVGDVFEVGLWRGTGKPRNANVFCKATHKEVCKLAVRTQCINRTYHWCGHM